MTTKKAIHLASLFALTLGMLVTLGAVNPGQALAGRPNHGHTTVHHGPRPGREVVSLPARHQTIRVRGTRYYYHGGVFYRPRHPGGFVTVAAPLGAVVSLPVGAVRVVIGGFSYYTLGGVYYQRVPAGYAVVPAPAVTEVVEASAIDSEVTVTAGRLNVRSGPGKQHPVISQVFQGETLLVKEQTLEWLYVRLPSGQHGWVMADYTAPQFPPAEG